MVHGLGEHAGRYERIARRVWDGGLNVYALDLRGHGTSDGRRGHARSLDQMLCDLDMFRRRASRQSGSGPTFLLGHSLGGLIVGRYVQEYSFPGLSGAILVAPFLRLAMPVPAWKIGLGRLADRWLPVLALDNGLREENLFREEEERRRYAEDPLVHRRISARLWGEMLREAQRFDERIDQVRLPLLFQLPGEDRIVDADWTRTVALRLGPAAEVREYPRAYHDPYHDPAAEQALTDLVQWLEARRAFREVD